MNIINIEYIENSDSSEFIRINLPIIITFIEYKCCFFKRIKTKNYIIWRKEIINGNWHQISNELEKKYQKYIRKYKIKRILYES